MPFDLTILIKKINGIKEAFENGNFADALVGALNTGSGMLQQRIFGENEDANGQSFGQYVGKKKTVGRIASKNKTADKRNKAVAGQSLTAYQRKRAHAGRQVLKKDLEFTGGLRRAIDTQIEDENAAVIQFNNPKAAKIARGQEQQIANIRNGASGRTKGTGPARIFKLSKPEKEKVVEQGKELIKQILKPK